MVKHTIDAACTKVSKNILKITPWPKLPIYGLKIDDLIRDKITDADILIGDVTVPNFNVYYEIGFAIGSGKPVLITLNSAIENASKDASLTGLFDVIGQIHYRNSNELAPKLESELDLKSLLAMYARPMDHSQPLYLLDTFAKTEFRNWVFQAISDSSLEVRRFDPEETTRLSINNAIADTTASAGMIIPLLSQTIVDNVRHNLRGAFLAGLGHGLNLDVKLLQYEDVPAPLDYRDLIETVRTKREVEKSVEEYCRQTLIRNQSTGTKRRTDNRSILERIDLGASAAEREQQKLPEYFISTGEYSRALRATGAIVSGRKGSGKTAIFYQVLADKGTDIRNLIIELNPASHNLSEMREQLLKVISAGVFDHTIAAFWQYILYAEILLKLREVLLPKAKYDFKLLKQINDVEAEFSLTNDMVAGDFTTRLQSLTETLILGLANLPTNADLRPHLTNILFQNKIPAIRRTVLELSTRFQKIILLFDNLDKGWPAGGIEASDVKMVHHLIDTLDKVQRELANKIAFEYLLFLRSDVYDQLVRETSDRQKSNVISVDWSDKAQLQNMLYRRATWALSKKEQDEVWPLINPALPGGKMAVDAIMESSLMRPRFAIDLLERAISFAINRGHGKVELEDVEAALSQHSIYLVSDFGYEIRDVSGVSENIFYHFLGEPTHLSEAQVLDIIGRAEQHDTKRVLDLLLWFGFLGIHDAHGKSIFIYDRNYDIRRLEAERDRLDTPDKYVVNPAFLRGLEN